MKKILSICLVLLTSFALCACSSEEGKETNNQTKTEEKIYGVGETITYKKDGQERVHFTVNSVSNTSDRNEFADSQPEQVIIIHYSYENIASEEDVYFSSVNFNFPVIQTGTCLFLFFRF